MRLELVAECTRILSRLHVLLADLAPGGAARELWATRAAALLRQIHPITAADIEGKRIARELVGHAGDITRFPTVTTSPATLAPPRLRLPAAICAGIG